MAARASACGKLGGEGSERRFGFDLVRFIAAGRGVISVRDERHRFSHERLEVAPSMPSRTNIPAVRFGSGGLVRGV
jgi:hypothetical protein